MIEETVETKASVYCIDTSSLIAMWIERYPKDVFPSLWKKVVKLVEERRLGLCKQVWDEVKNQDLKEFLFPKGSEKNYFLTASEAVRKCVNELTNKYPAWAGRKGVTRPADPYVVAHAKVQGMAVITEELRFDGTKKGEKRKIKRYGPKIPDVCKDFGVGCISALELFRKEEWKF